MMIDPEAHPIFRAAAAAADAVWNDVATDPTVPDAVLKNAAVTAYIAAMRVLQTEMCQACAHRAAYQIATGEVIVHSGNPVANLN